MRWLDHRYPVPEPLRGAVVALGNFDGFHLGHQAVAGEAIEWDGYRFEVVTMDGRRIEQVKITSAA